MQIGIKKLSPYQNEYTITRPDGTTDSTILDAKTYFIHDITHFVVEKYFGYLNGFWGMLAKGFRFNELLGKENIATADLRSIEKIVGPVQSVYMGFIPKEQFALYTEHLDFNEDELWLENRVDEVNYIVSEWSVLKAGEQLVLSWA